jgi:hypothetical protein
LLISVRRTIWRAAFFADFVLAIARIPSFSFSLLSRFLDARVPIIQHTNRPERGFRAANLAGL